MVTHSSATSKNRWWEGENKVVLSDSAVFCLTANSSNTERKSCQTCAEDTARRQHKLDFAACSPTRLFSSPSIPASPLLPLPLSFSRLPLLFKPSPPFSTSSIDRTTANIQQQVIYYNVPPAMSQPRLWTQSTQPCGESHRGMEFVFPNVSDSNNRHWWQQTPSPPESATAKSP